MQIEEQRNLLTSVLLLEDPTDGLWQLCNSGQAAEIIPELPALLLEQDPVHKHKDILAHTIIVTAKTRSDLRLRMAALFHDIGKPATRRFGPDGVTFRHHEAVGAKMARSRLRKLEFEQSVIDDVVELVRLSGRFKGYSDGWSDSAVRRYCRDAGPLLGLLNELVRSDSTTKNQRKEARLQADIDELEERILNLAEQDRVAAERPQLDGHAIMERYGVSGGRLVGKALKFLLELKRTEGTLETAEIEERLDTWWAEQQS